MEEKEKITILTLSIFILNTISLIMEEPLVLYSVHNQILTHSFMTVFAVSYILLWVIFIVQIKQPIYLFGGIIYLVINMAADVALHSGYYSNGLLEHLLIYLSVFFIAPISSFSYFIVPKFIERCYLFEYYFRAFLFIIIFIPLFIKWIKKGRKSVYLYPLMLTIIITYLNIVWNHHAIFETLFIPLISIVTLFMWIVCIFACHHSYPIILLAFRIIYVILLFHIFSVFASANNIWFPILTFISRCTQFFFNFFYFPDYSIYPEILELLIFFNIFILISFFLAKIRNEQFENNTVY